MNRKVKCEEFFVILNGKYGFPIPLTNDAEELILFATKSEADSQAQNTIFGSNFGYEVFRRGYGETQL